MRRVLAPAGRGALSVWGRIEGSPGMAALVEALARDVRAALGAYLRDDALVVPMAVHVVLARP